MTFHDRLCPFSMSFQYRLMEWILNKLDCHAHMFINHLLYVMMTYFRRQYCK